MATNGLGGAPSDTGVAAGPTSGRAPRGAGRTGLVVTTVVLLVALPVSVLMAAIAVPVTVMGLAGGGEPGPTAVLLGLLGAAVALSPAVILVGLVLMWVLARRGRRRGARRAALLALPFAALALGLAGWALGFGSFT